MIRRAYQFYVVWVLSNIIYIDILYCIDRELII